MLMMCASRKYERPPVFNQPASVTEENAMTT
jgi:hypothetical protein